MRESERHRAHLVEPGEGVRVEADADTAQIVGEPALPVAAMIGTTLPGRAGSQADATWAGLQPPCPATLRTALITASSRWSASAPVVPSRRPRPRGTCR